MGSAGITPLKRICSTSFRGFYAFLTINDGPSMPRYQRDALVNIISPFYLRNSPVLAYLLHQPRMRDDIPEWLGKPPLRGTDEWTAWLEKWRNYARAELRDSAADDPDFDFGLLTTEWVTRRRSGLV